MAWAISNPVPEAVAQVTVPLAYKFIKFDDPTNPPHQAVTADNTRLNIEAAHVFPGGSDEIAVSAGADTITLPNRAAVWDIEVSLTLYHNGTNCYVPTYLQSGDGSQTYALIEPFLGDGTGSDSANQHLLTYQGPLPAGETLRVFFGNIGDGDGSTSGASDDFDVYDYHIKIRELPESSGPQGEPGPAGADGGSSTEPLDTIKIMASAQFDPATLDAAATHILVEVWGGGGGGGTGGASLGGGRGGAYSYIYILRSALTGPIAVTVGDGGAVGSNGGTGGTTEFGTLCGAEGGDGPDFSGLWPFRRAQPLAGDGGEAGGIGDKQISASIPAANSIFAGGGGGGGRVSFGGMSIYGGDGAFGADTGPEIGPQDAQVPGGGGRSGTDAKPGAAGMVQIRSYSFEPGDAQRYIKAS